MARTKNSQVTFGILLAVVGGVLLLTRISEVQRAPAWLLGLGVGLAMIAIVARSYGSLVGGMILLGLGAGMLLGDHGVAGVPAGSWILIGLGVGFIGVYLIGLLLQLSSRWWPLVPGVVLLAVAGARYLRSFAFLPPELVAAVRVWWPIALVLAGILVVVKALRA
jgi:hypothetical protein